MHVPPRDFPILRSSPLWQQTWVHHGQSSRNSASGYGKWFPPLTCGPNALGDDRRRIIGFTTSNYRRSPDQLYRVYSSPGCRCPDCLSAAQSVEIMLVGITSEVAHWTVEHRCWFGSLATGYQLDYCSCGAPAVIGGTLWIADIEHWLERNLLGAPRGLSWQWTARDEASAIEAYQYLGDNLTPPT